VEEENEEGEIEEKGGREEEEEEEEKEDVCEKGAFYDAMSMKGKRKNVAEYLLDNEDGAEHVSVMLQIMHATGDEIVHDVYHIINIMRFFFLALSQEIFYIPFSSYSCHSSFVTYDSFS
jgi:hypothetical protein